MVIVAELVKRLIVVQEIVGSSPIFHTVGTQRVKDVVWNLFPQTQYRKLSCQSMGLALHPCGEMVNTTSLSLVSCWFDSSQGYNWSYSLIGKTYRYER